MLPTSPFFLSHRYLPPALLVVIALCINLLFFQFHRVSNFFSGTLKYHGEIAYNVYQSNSIKICPERQAHIAQLQALEDRIVHYHELDHTQFPHPSAFRDVHDTIGYGVLLGLFWKITDSLSYTDAQILQIILFSLLMILIYDCALLFGYSHRMAFTTGLLILGYLPLTFINVQAHRDIWAYYGIVLLLWMSLRVWRAHMSYACVAACGTLVALCQWMRPTICCTLFLIVALAGLAQVVKRQRNPRLLAAAGLALLMNVMWFWVPFMAYNYHAYDTCFVSCNGVNLIEGIGEYPNRWGYQMSDDACAQLVASHGARYGTPEGNSTLEHLFWQAVREDWMFVAGTVLRRIPRLFYFAAPFVNASRIPLSLAPLKICARICDIVTSRNLIQLFFLCTGWLGLLALFCTRRKAHAMLLASIILSSWPHSLSSHVEARYLITFYWVLAFASIFLLSRAAAAASRILRLKNRATIHAQGEPT